LAPDVLAWACAELYLAPAPSADEVVLPDLFRHRILLLGSPASRPEGLERVLVRGGFQVTETPSVSPPDFILYTPDAGAPNLADDVRELATQPTYGGAPVFVLLTHGPAEAATDVLLAGARDALVAPIQLPELRARLDAHIRARTGGRD